MLVSLNEQLVEVQHQVSEAEFSDF
jgi:hypothetical protein